MRRKNSLRLKDWNYAAPAWYFITLRTKQGKPFFGILQAGKTKLSQAGKIAQEEWLRSGNLRSDVELDEMIILPNHIHAIIVLGNNKEGVRAHCNAPKTNLSHLIRSFKSASTRRIRQIQPDFAWHRSFFDHIIRGEKSLERIRNYIHFNVEKHAADPAWQDSFFSKI